MVDIYGNTTAVQFVGKSFTHHPSFPSALTNPSLLFFSLKILEAV
jgi:hypothetical protein